jgi:hypothetical protein
MLLRKSGANCPVCAVSGKGRAKKTTQTGKFALLSPPIFIVSGVARVMNDSSENQFSVVTTPALFAA